MRKIYSVVVLSLLSLLVSSCESFRPNPALEIIPAVSIRVKHGVDKDNFVVSGNSHVWAIPVLVNYAKGMDVQVDFGSADPAESLYGRSSCALKCSIWINDTYPSNMQASTLLHELAHVLLPRYGELTIMEITAESVAYLVAKRVGLDTHMASFAYIGRINPAIIDTVITAKYKDINKIVDVLSGVLNGKQP